MALTLSQLLVKEAKAAIYRTALSVAQALGLPVSSWQPGDPTRSLYHVLAELLATLEEVVALFIAAGFLDYATGAWLILLAKQVFNVDAVEATYATTTIVLTNNGGGNYPGIEPGDLTFRSDDDKTYRNTTGGDLAPGPATTLPLTIVADEPGSASSAGVGEITEMVTTLLGVTCTNPSPAVGLDAESEDSIRQRCRDKLASLSPNGPADAYVYVAREPKLTGVPGVRARPYPDSDTGDVVLYVAGPAGALLEPDRLLVEAAIVRWATPLTITPAVLAATEVTVPVTYEVWIYDTANVDAATIEEAIESALLALFASRPIGGDIIPPDTTGKLYVSHILSVIRGVYGDDTFRVSVTAPAADVSLANGQVAKLGLATATVNIVEAP
jgi:phage-related baseplate assembly protein